MPNPIPGPIPLATATQQGQVSIAAQAFGGVKTFVDGAAVNIFDIRQYGAVANSTLAADDAAVAYDTLVAHALSLGDNAPTIYWPPGIWYIGHTLLNPGFINNIGDGPQSSIIAINPATTPGDIQPFSGPVCYGVYNQGYVSAGGAPGYAPALVGAGNSLIVGNNYPYSPTSLMLNGARALKLDGLSQLAIQWWSYVPPVVAPAEGGIVISSNGLLTGAFPGECLAIVIEDQGGGPFIDVSITTSNGVFTSFSAPGSIPYNTNVNLEVDYNGSFLDVYVAGVNVIHLAATGTLVQKPWENFNIGSASAYGPGSQNTISSTYEGKLDSLRISNIARHTGVGGFVPPVAKYAFDANTLSLWNFDQPLEQQKPWVKGLVQDFNQPAGTPIVHYGTFYTVGLYSPQQQFRNIQLNPNGYGYGYVATGNALGTMSELWIFNAYKIGLGSYSGETFAVNAYNVLTYNTMDGMGQDLWNFGSGFGLNDQASILGMSLTSGTYEGVFIQPIESGGTLNGIVIRGGAGAGNYFGQLEITNLGIDYEGDFHNLLGGMIIDDTCSGLTVEGAAIVPYTNMPGVTVPAVAFDGSPQLCVFRNCVFDVTPAPGAQLFKQVSYPGQTGFPSTGYYVSPVVVEDCLHISQNTIPWSLTPGFVVQKQFQQVTNQQSISTSDVLGNNLAGTFTVLHGFTKGTAVFPTPEPDTNYIVQCTYVGYDGSAPAAGSTLSGIVTNGKASFSMASVDPGGTCQTHWTYTMTRIPAPAAQFIYAPTIPSTPANVLVTVAPTGDWALGVTLVPASGHTWNTNGLGYQVIAEAGSAPPNYWQFNIQSGYLLTAQFAAGLASAGAFVSGNKLGGLLQPGPHNVAVGVQYAQGWIWVDGLKIPTPATIGYTNRISSGTQQTPLYIGEDSATAHPLTTATLRNMLVDAQVSKVITFEPDAGPGAQLQAALLGDDFTVGYGSTSTSGGWAQQLQENRYGITYYWNASNISQTAATCASPFWSAWGAPLAPSLTGLCILAGFWDVLEDVLGATVAATLTQLCNGTYASGIWTPPLPPTFPPYYSYSAYQLLGAFQNNNPGSGTVTIAGVTFPWSVAANAVTDPSVSAASMNALAALITASAPTLALVTPTVINLGAATGNQSILVLTAKAIGTAGNSVTVSFTDPTPTGFHFYPGGATLVGGVDNVTTINGVALTSNFDTNADTTVNNLIAAIAANGALNTLVTGTLVNHKMVLTAQAAGAVGNAITIVTNQVGSSLWNSPLGGNPFASGTLQGGVNGAVQEGVEAIVLCTIPPFGQSPYYTVGREAQRNIANGIIRAFVAAGVTIADVDLTLRDPAAHQNILPAYLAADNIHVNDSGQTALYGLLNPLLP